MRGYVADVRTLFNFAARRGYVKSTAAAAVELPGDTSKLAPVLVHSPRDIAQLLSTALEAPDVCRHLAIRYFAGVRTAEAHRLREVNILEAQGYLEIPAAAAKTRRRRLVKIQPVLASWLALGGTLRPMRPDTVRAVIKRSGVHWPANVTRHSFCSYHLAEFESASKTALEAGHSEAMLFAHYRELVTKEQAGQFWTLTPAAAESLLKS